METDNTDETGNTFYGTSVAELLNRKLENQRIMRGWWTGELFEPKKEIHEPEEVRTDTDTKKPNKRSSG